MSSTAFSSSGEDAITRTIDVQVDNPHVPDPSTSEFDEYYEIASTSRAIIDGGYKRVALQFPDELLRDSTSIYRKLRCAIGEPSIQDVEMYVLADTSYGSCCVDEVAAQHVDADAVVHYGHACMSQTYRLPVIYVFGRKSVEVDDCVERLAEVLTQISHDRSSPNGESHITALFRHDVGYSHQADYIVQRLQEQVGPLGIAIRYSQIPTRLYPLTVEGANREVPALQSQHQDEDVILYVGGESLTLTNLLMTHASCEVYSYHPESRTTRLESTRTNKLLMRRYSAMLKARDADVFGILVGTLGVAHYLPLIAHIRTVLSQKHKKCYTISVGKLNPAKLANFMEIECFVVVACPENSVVEAKEFLRPIVTPYELAVALQAEPSWTGRYILDFGKLLEEGHGKERDAGQVDDDRPVFSLITGTYRHPKRFGEFNRTEEPDSSALVLRSQEQALTIASESAAAQFLQSRTYRGLEVRAGENAPGILEQGRSGNARDYQGS